MATWNHGDKTAGSTVQFNGKSYVTRKDTGQTVYDTVAAAAADPGLTAEIESLKQQLAAVSTGSGSGYGSVQFAGDNSSTYYYRKIKASTSNTVREEFETDALAMSDGSVPSAAILMINCVNLNDNTFESPDKARAMMMYEPPADSTAAVSCYINSRDGSGMSTSGLNVVTGTYTGNSEGQVSTWQATPYKVIADGQRINLGVKPIRLAIYGDKSQLLSDSGKLWNKNRVNGVLALDWNVSTTHDYLINVDDTGFEVYHSSQSRSGSSKNGWHYPSVYGANEKDVVYTYVAEYPSGSLSTTSTGGTYGPGTQAIVPVHANGKAKLIAHINKLAAGQVPDQCFLEMWVVGVMGGGGSVPDNNYADLLKRVETLENNSATVTGTVDLGAVGYTFTATARRQGSSKGASSWSGHSVHNFEAITDAIPSYADSDKNFNEISTGDTAITGEITNTSGTYRLQYSPPSGGTKTSKFGSFVGNTSTGTAVRVK